MRPNRTKEFFLAHPNETFTRSEVAAALGVASQTVSGNLTKLHADGVVEQVPGSRWRTAPPSAATSEPWASPPRLTNGKKPQRESPPPPMYVEVGELTAGGTLLQRDDGTLWIATRFLSPIERLRVQQ